MSQYIINHSLLNKNQHRFMSQKSLATILIESLDILTDSLNNGKLFDIKYTEFS